MQSFFGTLNCELVHRNEFTTIAEAERPSLITWTGCPIEPHIAVPPCLPSYIEPRFSFESACRLKPSSTPQPVPLKSSEIE
jgi:hypothetical protein